MKTRAIRFEGARDYPISTAEAWRLVADTDHMNRVLGLPPMESSPREGGGIVRAARTRLWGVVPLRWREYPFEWVRERRLAVRRDFERGPLRRFEIAFQLEPLQSGHATAGPLTSPVTRVSVSMAYTPAGVAGRLLAGRIGPRGVESILSYCDRYVSRRAAGAPDPRPPPAETPQVDRARLDDALERLARAPVRPDLLPPLRQRILEGTDAQVLRVRPYEVAEAWPAGRGEVLRLLLHATRAGLFDLRWELMCPACRVPKGEVGSLASLPGRFHCETCGIDYEADFDRRVELRFSVHPAVRRARDDVYCIGSPMRTPHVLAQQFLASGEDGEVELPYREALQLRALGAATAVQLAPAATAGPSLEDGRIRLSYGEDWRVSSDRGAAGMSPVRVEFTPGRDVLHLRNEGPEPIVAILEREDWDPNAATAAEVTALQEFRDLFSSEVLAPGQEVGVSSIAVLFTDLKGSTSLYEGVGDAPAYGRVNRHFEFLKEKISAGGAIVKTIGDAVMGVFVRLEDALSAALAVQAEISGWCRREGIDPALVLKVGVHHGPTIAVNANGRLDYFGRTVNLAARLGRESAGGDVVLLEEIFSAEPARAALAGRIRAVEEFRAELRGVEGERQLVRLWPEPRD